MEMKNVDVKVKDDDATINLLCSLPPSFKNFLKCFTVEKDTILIKDVRFVIYSCEFRPKVSGSRRKSQVEGLMAKGPDHGRGCHEKKKNYTQKERQNSRCTMAYPSITIARSMDT